MVKPTKLNDVYGGSNRKLILVIVYIALFLDNMLLTTVVPIIPEYLFRLEHPNDTSLFSTDQSTTGGSATTAAANIPESDMAAMRQAIPYLLARLKNHQVGAKHIGIGNKQYDHGTDIVMPVEHKKKLHKPQLADKHKLLNSENVKVGLMFGSKALVQLISNPFVGPLTNRVGYTVPMFTGFVIMFVSTLIFAFGTSYAVLFFARTLQGIGSACTSTSGMGMLAQMYPDDKERGAAMGIALGGLALGVLVGPPFGGVLYKFSGKELPFVILALLALFDGSAITIGNLGMAILEPSLPIWMIETMNADSAVRGAAFLPSSVAYLVGTTIFGPLAHKIGRWLSTLIGLVVVGACLIAIPSATNIYELIAPNGFLGFAIGHLVDIRHVGIYGSIYAIADGAFCMAFAIGPYVSGPIVEGLGFPNLMYIAAALTLLYAPMMVLLKNPPATAEEKMVLIARDFTGTESETSADIPQSDYNIFDD